jgi:hypothetical protein
MTDRCPRHPRAVVTYPGALSAQQQDRAAKNAQRVIDLDVVAFDHGGTLALLECSWCRKPDDRQQIAAGLRESVRRRLAFAEQHTAAGRPVEAHDCRVAARALEFEAAAIERGEHV